MQLTVQLVVALVLAVSLCSAIPDYQGLPPGPYCASPRRGCCTGRVDSCAAPIVGTMCYCDEFCDRVRAEDCCPDYWTFCKNEPSPESIATCYHEGKYYAYDKTAKINCNKCKCEIVDGKADFLCETNECIVETDIIESINSDKRINGWQASNYSTFWGRTLAEGARHRLGTVRPERSVMRMHPVRRIYDPASLPTSFDASERWPGWVSGIADQGWCASSWAVSTASVASDRFAIMSRGAETAPLSAQQLLSCNNRGQQSCAGGHLDKAWMFVRKHGLVDDHCYPYTGKDDKCRFGRKKGGSLRAAGCTPPQDVDRTDMYKTGPAYRLGNETDIMHEITNSGPVQATMQVYRDFFLYSSGVYRRSRVRDNSAQGYHSVRIVGWGVDRSVFPPVKYWKVANSWGQNWGEDGYFRIVRGSNECEIESYVLGTWAHVAEPIKSANEVI